MLPGKILSDTFYVPRLIFRVAVKLNKNFTLIQLREVDVSEQLHEWVFEAVDIEEMLISGDLGYQGGVYSDLLNSTNRNE